MALTVRTSVTVRVKRVTQRQGSVCLAVQRGAGDPSVTKVKHIMHLISFDSGFIKLHAVFSCKVFSFYLHRHDKQTVKLRWIHVWVVVLQIVHLVCLVKTAPIFVATVWMARPVTPFLGSVQGANVRPGGRDQCVSKVKFLQSRYQNLTHYTLLSVILRSILIFQLFTGKSFIFQNVKNINMEPRVSMTAGIALISRTAKKHRESAKRVVTVAGMDRTAIIVSNNKDCGKI